MIPASSILPKKRAVQVVISSSGARATLSPSIATAYLVQAKQPFTGVIRVAQVRPLSHHWLLMTLQLAHLHVIDRLGASFFPRFCVLIARSFHFFIG